MASFTPQEIEQFLQEFFDVVGARQYVGARYVPIFGRAGEDTVEWDDGAPYEPLTVVMHEGVSYVSRRYVPRGIQVTDTAYWVETYRFNAQVEQYRQEVLQFDGRIDAVADAIADEAQAREEADAQVLADVADDYVPYPDPDHYPQFGTAGQVLTTLGNGGTMWDDPVIVTEEVAGPLIEDWLDAHPEATTTVQDGAITTPKIADDSVTNEKLAQRTGILPQFETLKRRLPEDLVLQWSTHGTVTHHRTYTITLPPSCVTLFKFTNNSSETGYIGGLVTYGTTTLIDLTAGLQAGASESRYFLAPSDAEYDVTLTVNNINFRDISIEVYAISSTVFPINIIGSSGGSYATYLPDADDALENTAYLIVTTDDTSLPQHLPTLPNYSYQTYLLETYHPDLSPNRYQRLSTFAQADYVQWTRFYRTGTQSWSAWIKSADATDSLRVYPQQVIGGAGQNYTTVLPDFDNARTNTIYRLTSTDVTNLPAHCPTLPAAYLPFLLTTYVDDADSRYQILEQMDRTGVTLGLRRWTRWKTQGTWSQWSYLEIIPKKQPLDIVVGPGRQYTSILEGVLAALAVPHSHVLVKAGTYNIAQEILAHYGSTFLSGNDVTYRGIPLGNFITVEFETGAVAELDLTDASYSDAARGMVSIFNSGDSNPEYNNTGFTLINANLVATNCRYAVHDEHGGVLDSYSNHYVNCRMHKNVTMQFSAEGYGTSNGYALGGGLGEHGYITFDGCQFSRTNTSGQTQNVDFPIFYHTSLYSQTQASQSRIFVRDCVIDTTIRFNTIGTGAMSQMFVDGCSLGSAPTIDGNLTAGELIAWNNEIRTP